MSRCPNLDCVPQPSVKATTDIAGPGVLYAYLISALFTIIAIVLSYLSDSLPDWYLNETDKAVIASFQACLPSGNSAARIRSAYAKVKVIILLGRTAKPHRKLTKKQRQELVKRFILTLSDQQLATGLAILVAAAANQCTLTVWEFQLAFSLAWFSSTTHLATLDCLREYFIEHGSVRNWRIFGMLAILVLLVYCLIMSMASVDPTIPLQCTFTFFGDRGEFNTAPLYINDILSASLTLVVLTSQYIVRILWSFRRDDGAATHTERAIFNMRTRHYRRLVRPSVAELRYVVDEAVLERIVLNRRQELEQIRSSRGIRRHYLIAWRASSIYSQSFLSHGPMLTFMISFGFAQLYLNRWRAGVPVEIDTSMSFGQITPLFLLVLPILAAAEIYYEIQDAPTHEVPETSAREHHSHQSSSGTWPVPSKLARDHAFLELNNTGSIDVNDANRDYDTLLPYLKRYFYQETKLIAAQEMTNTGKLKQHTSTMPLKAHLVSSYHALSMQEDTLKATTLTSIIEFAVCVVFSIALGILLYVEGSGEWTAIVSYVLFAICLVYKILEWIAYVMASKVNISESDYRRLVMEARESLRRSPQYPSTPENSASAPRYTTSNSHTPPPPPLLRSVPGSPV